MMRTDRRALLRGAVAMLPALATMRGVPASAQAGSASIAALRQKARKSTAHSDETALASLIAAGEAMIRAERARGSLGGMHRLVTELQQDADLVYALAARNPANQTLARLAFLTALGRRGRLARERRAAFAALRRSMLAPGSAVAQRLQSAQDALTADAIALGLSLSRSQVSIPDHVAALARIDAEIEGAAHGSATFALSVSSFPMPEDTQYDWGIDNLITNVGFGNFAVIYVQYDTAVLAGAAGSPEFIAIVVHAGAPVRIVPLGSAARISVAVRDFRGAVSDPLAVAMPAASALHALIFAPLKAFLRAPPYNVNMVSICPDGDLYLAPFGALVDGNSYLCDVYPVIQNLDSPIDLGLIGSRRSPHPSKTLLAFANPDFGTSSIDPLPNAQKESENISRKWPAKLREMHVGADANAARFRTLAPSAGYIHFATHGGFFPNPVGLPAAGLPPVVDSALARSVCLLAPDPGAPAPGFISALDVEALDLSSTQLVVLAACESALGEFEAGQGVYGLRQAFLTAGAETVVSALWEINDQATSNFMPTFYGALMEGAGRSQALQMTAKLVRGRYPHPYYWAPFVLTGYDTTSPALPPLPG